MAIIQFVSGKKTYITPEKALVVWKILNAEMEPNDKQAAYVSQVKRVYMNRYNAPQSYLQRYKHLLPNDTPIYRYKSVVKGRLPYKD